VAVERIETTISSGVYSAVTDHPDGMIIVNGIKVSCFSINHRVKNIFYQLIHRNVYFFLPESVSKLVLSSDTLFFFTHASGRLAENLAQLIPVFTTL